jgi:hypothetical protein
MEWQSSTLPEVAQVRIQGTQLPEVAHHFAQGVYPEVVSGRLPTLEAEPKESPLSVNTLDQLKQRYCSRKVLCLLLVILLLIIIGLATALGIDLPKLHTLSASNGSAVSTGSSRYASHMASIYASQTCI